jgi:hypothetical protein
MYRLMLLGLAVALAAFPVAAKVAPIGKYYVRRAA